MVDFRTRYLPRTSLITASANVFGPSIPSQLHTRININIFQTSWKMCTARNTSGELALLLSLDGKFVSNFHKNNQYFNTHHNIASYLSNGVTISRYREGDLQSITSDAQLFLQPQIQTDNEH